MEVAQQIVHVHNLGPPLLVSDLVLVLEVSHHLGAAWQDPHQTASVGSFDFQRGLNANAHAVDLEGCLIDGSS